ncbi:MAG: CDP-glycerol glycerophosphotransferase family protein, partial [Pseudomonadota bacterium]
MRDLLGKLVPVLLRPLLFVLYGLSGFWPRNPRLWVFGSWDGQRFTDNGAALFLYCLEHSSLPIHPVWITKAPSIVDDVRSRGGKAYLSWSPQGMLACLRAGIYVFDGYTKDINHWLSRGARRAHLRHGTGIKKIEREIDLPSHRLYQLFHGKPWQRWYWRFLIPWHDTRLDLVFATSEQHAEQAMRFYGVPRERVAITGSPRNDILFSVSQAPIGNQPVRQWIGEQHQSGVKVFLWMPTFRDNKSSVFQESWGDV